MDSRRIETRANDVKGKRIIGTQTYIQPDTISIAVLTVT